MGLFRLTIGTPLLVAAVCLAEISAIDAYIEAEMSLNHTLGAAVSVWSKGGIIYAKGFGVRSTATNLPMAADTLIDLASVSKSLTGVAVDKLNRQGRIHPDAPVTKYLPELGDAFGRVRIRHVWRQLLFPAGDNYFSRSTTTTALT